MKQSGKVFNAIHKAEEICLIYGEQLLQDPIIAILIEKYKKAIDATGNLFKKIGVIDACHICAQKNHGSCCFEGMENNYTPVLLLINMLMGVELPHKREHQSHCFFVGSGGCKLMARYHFCVNYFCPDLEKAMGKDKLNSLLTVVGEEIFAGWELEKSIYNFLQKTNP